MLPLDTKPQGISLYAKKALKDQLKRMKLNDLCDFIRKHYEDASDEAYLIYSAGIDLLSEKVSQSSFDKFVADLGKRSNIKVNA